MKQALVRIGRIVLWPLRRFFDPRFGGLARAIEEGTRATVETRESLRHALAEIQADLRPTPAAEEASGGPAGSIDDFNVFLHELRSQELRRLPPGARTVVHGGCAGTWYFEWFDEHYATAVERHIGIDAFVAAPPELGDRVEWLERSLGDLEPIGDGEADLVFAGQVIEHLWPEEAAGFLFESHRILRPGGILALDSPNRRVTGALGWDHPEHTLELRPDEILELLALSGFENARLRGVWLCFDGERNAFLPLDATSAEWPAERRAAEAAARPEDSFVWWAECRRTAAQPDPTRLERRIGEIHDVYRRSRFARSRSSVGVPSGVGEDRLVSAREGEAGYLVSGPNVPMPAGRWLARFRLAAGASSAPGPFGLLDVTVGSGAEVVARAELTPSLLPTDGVLHEVAVPFELDRTAIGVEFRVQTFGAVPMSALLHVDVTPRGPAIEAGTERHRTATLA